MDFEDVIRTAVSLGGDCDTLTCIAGGMAEAFYGIPAEMVNECRKRLPEDMLTSIILPSSPFRFPKLSVNDILFTLL